MLKNFILTLLLLQTLTISLKAETTCADNPLLPYLEKFIEEQNDFIEKETSESTLRRYLSEIQSPPHRNLLLDWDKLKENLKEKIKETFNKNDGESIQLDGENPETYQDLSDSIKEKLQEKASKLKEKLEKHQQELKEKFETLKEEIKTRIKQEIKDLIFTQEDLDSLKSSHPKLQEDLDICQASLENKPSCCSKEHIQKFKKLTKGYYLKKLENVPLSAEIFEKIEQIFTLNFENSECPFESLQNLYYKIKKDEKIAEILKKERNCQKDAIFISGNLIRGTICQACMDPQEFEKFFTTSDDDGEGENLKLLTAPDTLQKYRDAMDEQFTCVNEAVTDLHAALEQILKINQEEQEENTEKSDNLCSELLDSLKDLSQETVEEKVCDYDPLFYQDGCLGEIEVVQKVKESLERRRLIQGSGGSYQEDNDGVSGVYQEDKEEEKQLGDIPDLVELQEEEDAKEADALYYQEENEQNKVLENSSSVLSFMVLSVLVFVALI